MKAKMLFSASCIFFLFFSQFAFAKFIVFSFKPGAGLCKIGEKLKLRAEIPTLPDGVTIELKFEKNSELIILDTRFEKSNQYLSWKITPQSNFGKCTKLKISANKNISMWPGNSLKVLSDGYKGSLVTEPPNNPIKPNQPAPKLPLPPKQKNLGNLPRKEND